MWDTTAYQVTIKVIGTVESSFDYGAVNPTDPISIGFAQWYATRASSLLRDMRSTNPTEWASLVGTQIDTDLDAHDDTDSWWTHRYLSSREILNLRPVLRATANKAVQDQTMVDDIDNSYLPECADVGIDSDTNTEVAEYYMVMYHQSPLSAHRVINAVGGGCTLARLHSATLNDRVFSQYRSRYTTAYDLIVAQDTTGVGTGFDNDTDTTGDSGGISTQLVGDSSYITRAGNDMHLLMRDGTRQVYRHTSAGLWIAPFDDGTGAPPVIDPDQPIPDGDPPVVTGAIGDMIAWLAAHVDDFAYSQGAGRLTPETSGYTDCSGLMYWVFKKFANMNIGTFTGNQYNSGKLISTNKVAIRAETGLLPGDLVFYNWSGVQTSTHPYNHVAMYIGSDQIYTHGGPDPGPDLSSHSANVDLAALVRVERYITD